MREGGSIRHNCRVTPYLRFGGVCKYPEYCLSLKVWYSECNAWNACNVALSDGYYSTGFDGYARIQGA